MKLAIGHSAAQPLDARCLFDRPAEDADFQDYNRLLGNIVASNASDRRFLVSPTLTRIEAQTAFFDQVHRFTLLAERIEAGGEGISVENLGFATFTALLAFARARGLPCRFDRGRALLARLRRSWALFALKVAAATLYEAYLTLLSRLLVPLPAGRRETVLFSFFDGRSKAADGAYRDPYFQPLLGRLRAKEDSFLVVVHPLGRLDPLAALRALFDIRAMAGTTPVVPAQRLLSLSDVVRTAARSLDSSLSIPGPLLYRGRDISALLNVSLREDLALRNNWFFAHKASFVAENILSWFKPVRIVYPYENHPWEKMMVRQRNEAGSAARLIGFQHTSFSPKLLNHFPSEAERLLPVYPDRILTTGPILCAALEERGCYPPGVLRAGCALRHEYLFRSRPRPRRANPTRQAAFAFSSDPKTYPALLSNLERVFDGLDATLYLKCHPLLDEERLLPDPLPKGFKRVAPIPWDRLYDEIDILLYHDNSLGIEAMYHGVPACYFGLAGESYDCDRMFGSAAAPSPTTVSEFRSALRRAFDGAEGARQSDEELRRYCRDYFSEITAERLELFLQ